MEIKLIVKNKLEDALYQDVSDFPADVGKDTSEYRIRRIKPYDEEKWKDGSIYEFNTLKEVADFYDSCNIDFTEEYADSYFDDWHWEEVDIDYVISKEEDNLIELYISTHDEFRD